MSDELTLPGTIPGLLRRCSPVYDALNTMYGTVVDRETGSWVHSNTEGDGDIHPLDEHWGLDLTDATGRAHAAWWLLDRQHPRKYLYLHTAARLWLDLMMQSDVHKYNRLRLWKDLRQWDALWTNAVLLCPLDEEDPRLLDDGSRWVDAEALRLVCLSVAGLS